MKHTLVRIASGVPEVFIALPAGGGGIAPLAGTYQDGVLIEAGGRGQFPLEWLLLLLGLILLIILTAFAHDIQKQDSLQRRHIL